MSKLADLVKRKSFERLERQFVVVTQKCAVSEASPGPEFSPWSNFGVDVFDRANWLLVVLQAYFVQLTGK